MKVQWALFVTLYLTFTVLPGFEAAPREIRCNYDEFTVEDIVGKLSCIPCRNCTVGEGLSPQCGSYIPYGSHIECKPCVSGVSYSSTYSIESCQPCGICVDHQKVLQKCNSTHNSICAKDCDVGFYLSSVVGDCQECSWCCHDTDPSEYEPQCKKDGMPFYKQCSVDESIRCSPRCTNQQYVIVTAKPLKQSCYDCPHCGVGQGLYPKCQSVLTSIKESKCQSCIPGKTYSATKDSSSCKPCKVCGVGKKTERSCNVTYDTLCGYCNHGFYNASIGGDKEINCQRCSYCCGDEEDVIIPECKAQGMPKNMQCAYTTRAITKCAPVHVDALENKIAWILGSAGGILILAVVIIIGTCKYWRYKQKGYKKLVNESQMKSTQVVFVPGKESPSEESTPTNIEFRYSGITVQCDAETGKDLLKEMSVEICWDRNKDLPKRKEIYLSPMIQFHYTGYQNQTSITLDIPHSAFQQEKNNTWKIKVLKVALHSKDETNLELTELSDNTEININPCSVRFKVKELAAYVVVGEAGDPKHAKKRMQCAVFGAKPLIGETYSLMLYLLDDGELYLKKLEHDEKKEGRYILKKLSHTLHPDMDVNSVIGVAIENKSKGWKGELFKEVIECSDWMNSYQTIPNITASFEHINQEMKDFQCNFKLKYKDTVKEIPVFHFSESLPTGIQPIDEEDPPPYDTLISINESQTPNHLYDRYLSSVPKEVLAKFCESLDQSLTKDHTRIESVATRIIPSITSDEVNSVSESDKPFTSLIDLAYSKEIALTAANVQHALEEERMSSHDELLPYLYKENSPQLV